MVSQTLCPRKGVGLGRRAMFGIEKGELLTGFVTIVRPEEPLFCFNIAPLRSISNKTFCNNVLGVIDNVLFNQFMQKELQLDILGA